MGGISLLIRCSGTNPRPPVLGEVGDIEGVVEFEEETQPGDTPPRPDPGRLERSQALYCSPPRPDPGRESREKAALDSCAAI